MIKNQKMLGVWIDSNIFEKLGLIAGAAQTNRSKIVRDLLLSNVNAIDDTILIQKITDNCIIEFNEQKNMNFKKYISILKPLLLKKFDSINVEIIISKLEAWKENAQ